MNEQCGSYNSAEMKNTHIYSVSLEGQLVGRNFYEGHPGRCCQADARRRFGFDVDYTYNLKVEYATKYLQPKPVFRTFTKK